MDKTVEKTVVTEELGEKLGEGSEKSSEKILAIIKENEYATTKQLATALRITTRAVEKQIAKLKKKRLLKRVGPDKGGH